MFSLVDSVNQEIRGLVDCRAEGQVDIAALTNYTLKPPLNSKGECEYKDIQQKCVLKKTRLAIPNVSEDLLTNKDVVSVVSKANQEAIVLFPLVWQDEVIGTMHIERDDKELPNHSEMESLTLFAQPVAVTMNATQELDALEEALHQQKEKVVVCDVQGKAHFANRIASESYNLDLGWQTGPNRSKSWMGPETQQAFDNALRSQAKHTVTKWEQDSLRVIEAEPILGLNGKTNRFLIQIHNLDSSAQLFNAMKKFASCTDLRSLADAMLGELKQHGHQWGRFYKCVREVPNALESLSVAESEEFLLGISQFGSARATPYFEDGTAKLSKQQRTGNWDALDRKEIRLYSRDRER